MAYCNYHSCWKQILMKMMMKCFCGMVDQRKTFSLIPSRDHCQRSSPSRISDTPRTVFEPAQNLSSGLVEWCCSVVITTTSRRHQSFRFQYIKFYLKKEYYSKKDISYKVLILLKKLKGKFSTRNIEIVLIIGKVY